MVWAFDKFAAEEKVIIQKEQSGQAITVKAEDLIQIELPELGSAGYSWYIDNLDSQYLEFISEQTRKVSEEGKIGAPIMHVWCLRTKKVGQTEIKMECYRKWEGVKKSTDHFSIKIKILKNGR
jgi:predicted secreted protein